MKVLQHQIKKLQSNPIVIAIDGHSSSGKSTLAKALAKALGYIHLDSGAMYRAVALLIVEKGIELSDLDGIKRILANLNLKFEKAGEDQHILINGRNVSQEIRTQKIAAIVSEVAAISEVRRVLVKQQQLMGEGKGIVMDGRDIGTVVFPYAEFKLFITAEMDVRVKRRHSELKAKGYSTDIDEVLNNLEHRDYIDSTREDSPLRQADDAILLDTSDLNHLEQLQKAMNLLISKFSNE